MAEKLGKKLFGERDLFLVTLFFLLFLSFLDSFLYLKLFNLKVNSSLIFFVLIQRYFSFFPLLFLSSFAGLFLDFFALSFPLRTLEFFLFLLIIYFFREKIFAKDNFLSLVFLLIFGEIILNFSGCFSCFFSSFFLKNLIFNLFLFIIVFLLKEKIL